MGLVPEWFNKGERPMGNVGQYGQSNMFTNPTYEQQSRMGRMAQMLRNPQQPSMQQPQNPPMQQPGMLMNPQNQLMTNWNQQYQGQ